MVVEENNNMEEDDKNASTTDCKSIPNESLKSKIITKSRNFTVKNDTDKSKYYTVNIESNTCTCSDFVYRKSLCKHIIAAKLLSTY